MQRLIDRRKKVLKIPTLEAVWQTLDEQASVLEKTINPAKLVKRLFTLSQKLSNIETKIGVCFRNHVNEKDYTNKMLCDQLAEQNRQQQQMQTYFLRLEQKLNELMKLNVSAN